MPQRPPRDTSSSPVDPAAADWQEIQDHQYVPGHFTGRNLAPHLRQPRPGTIGYVFVALGMIFLAMGIVALAATIVAGNPAPVALLGPGALGLLMGASGASLLRR